MGLFGLEEDKSLKVFLGEGKNQLIYRSGQLAYRFCSVIVTLIFTDGKEKHSPRS